MDIGARLTQPSTLTDVATRDGALTQKRSRDVIQPQSLPESYQMAAPLNEADFTALLMSSPLYRKLENIKKLVEEGAFIKNGQKPADGECRFGVSPIDNFQKDQTKYLADVLITPRQ